MRKVNNINRKFGSAPVYYHHKEKFGPHYLFTEAELAQANQRAINNSEDLAENISQQPNDKDLPVLDINDTKDKPKASLEGCLGIILAIVGLLTAIFCMSIFI